MENKNKKTLNSKQITIIIYAVIMLVIGAILIINFHFGTKNIERPKLFDSVYGINYSEEKIELKKPKTSKEYNGVKVEYFASAKKVSGSKGEGFIFEFEVLNPTIEVPGSEVKGDFKIIYAIIKVGSTYELETYQFDKYGHSEGNFRVNIENALKSLKDINDFDTFVSAGSTETKNSVILPTLTIVKEEVLSYGK